VSLAERRTVGVEALVRWQHPERGLLPPAEFVPPAERTELFRPLTLWVLDATLAQAARWRERGIELDVAVNLSPRNLIDSDLPADVALLLERHQVEPARLELEITESTLMADAGRACTVLDRLRELGVRIAIDDFGTGYSSLSYLKRLPIDTIKVDRSFVMAMEENAADAAIVRSTIALAGNLGLAVVAEGVESEAVLRELGRLGCDAAQGFHMSRPLPAVDLEAWLRQAAAPSAASRSSTGGLSVRSPL
jgi:EAL domain-containing protein (putative c-di-GMP-specific phosphodiesterase class I)